MQRQNEHVPATLSDTEEIDMKEADVRFFSNQCLDSLRLLKTRK